MSNRIATIGRYTVLEALRTRLPLVTVLAVGLLLAASWFVREIAITDSARIQTAFYAAAARFAIVFIAALHTISSMARDFQDKGFDMILALDLPRSHYVVGKLAGFLVIGAGVGVFAGAALVLLVGPAAAIPWTLSLVLELAIVVALSLFCVITFNSLMPAASFVFAFYVLARVIAAVRLISANPLAERDAPSHQIMRWLIEGVALVVPPLGEWTRTDWLVDAVPAWRALAGIAGHSLLLVVILTAAAIFDLHRRDL